MRFRMRIQKTAVKEDQFSSLTAVLFCSITQLDLWKIPVNVASVQKSYKDDGFFFYFQSDAIISHPNPAVVALGFQSFEIFQLIQALGNLNGFDDLLHACEQVFLPGFLL